MLTKSIVHYCLALDILYFNKQFDEKFLFFASIPPRTEIANKKHFCDLNELCWKGTID